MSPRRELVEVKEREDSSRNEEHVGYWGDAGEYLPLSALPVGADAQIEFFEHHRALFAVESARAYERDLEC